MQSSGGKGLSLLVKIAGVTKSSWRSFANLREKCIFTFLLKYRINLLPLYF